MDDRKDGKKGQPRKKPKRWQRQVAKKKKRRPQQGDGFSLKLFFPGVLGSSGVISHDDSR